MRREKNQHLIGAFYGLMGGICLSLGGPLIRFVSEDTTAWQVLSWRSYYFAVLMFAIAIWRSKTLSKVFKDTINTGWRLIPIALVVGLGQISYLLGLINTKVANVAFIVGSSPLFAAFFAWVFLREKLSIKGFIALLCAMGGVAIMMSEDLSGGDLWGKLFALGAMITYVIYVLILRTAKHVDTFVASGLGGLLAAFIATWFARHDGLHIRLDDLAYAVALGVIQVGAGFAFVTLAAQKIPAAEVTLLILLEAILGPLLVWILIGEAPSLLALLGGAVIIASVAIFAVFALSDEKAIARDKRRQYREPREPNFAPPHRQSHQNYPERYR